MKPNLPTLLPLFAALCFASPVMADSYRHDNHRSYRHDPPRHHHHNHWNQAATALAIAGLVGTASYYSYAPQAPVIIAPGAGPYQAPPSPDRIWYYCASARQYYPYTPYCPEGWQAITAQPQW